MLGGDYAPIRNPSRHIETYLRHMAPVRAFPTQAKPRGAGV